MKIFTKRINFYFACLAAIAITSVPNLLNAAWNPPVTLQDHFVHSPDDYGPQLSLVNIHNDAIAVWTTIPNDLDIIFGVITASSYTFGSGWSTPVFISPFSGTGFEAVGDPAVALNNNGYAVAIYEAEDSTTTVKGIFSATRSATGLWSGVQRVTNHEVQSTEFDPEGTFVSINDTGLAVATWGEFRADSSTHIMANFLPMGGSWGTPVSLFTPTAWITDDAPISAMNQNGDIVVVWRQGNGEQVAASTFNPNTNAWTSIVLDTSIVPNGATLPRVGIDSNGNAVAIWARTIGTFPSDLIFEVVASSFINGVWGPVVVVATIPGLPLTPDVVVDPFGNATGVWSTADQTFASSLPFGGSWSAPTLIGNGFLNTFLIDRPIAVDNIGDVIVMITQDDNNLQSIAKPMGGDWLEPLNITNPGEQKVNNIGLGPCGFALALWLKNDQPPSAANNEVQAADNFAVFDVPPVSNFSGVSVKDKFATQVVRYNILTWSVDNPCIAEFLLFSNGVLIATIPASEAGSFTVPKCTKGSTTFTIIPVNVNGIQGPPTTIVVP